jgi:hypothetical protein
VKIADFLSYLAGLNIEVVADGEQLRLNDSQGALTPALRAELAEREARAEEDLGAVLAPIVYAEEQEAWYQQRYEVYRSVYRQS